MKTLEAWCKAKGYQGGTIWQMLEDVRRSAETLIPENNGPYSWGVREAIALRHGDNIMNYPVPVNSFVHDRSESVAIMEYLCGLFDVLEDNEFTTEGKPCDKYGNFAGEA